MADAVVALLVLLLVVIILFLALVWRDNRQTVAQIEQFQRSWRQEIRPYRSLLNALGRYDAARQQVLQTRRFLDDTHPASAAHEQHRVALIEAQVAYDEARQALHQQLDRQPSPREVGAAGVMRSPTTPQHHDDMRDNTARG